MKDSTSRKTVLFTLFCIAVLALTACKPEPDPTYSVTYDKNGATGGSVPVDKNAYDYGDTATILDGSSDLVKAPRVFALSWNTAADGSGTAYFPGDSFKIKDDITLYARWSDRAFFALDMTDNSIYTTVADLRQTGDRCVVYAEVSANVPDAVVQSVVSEFDTVIYPRITTVYGTPYDVGIKDKTVLLLLDIKDGYSGSGGYMAGYFVPDMLFVGAYSNKEDMLFLDTNPADSSSLIFKETIAHEFQHLINFSKHGIGTTPENASQQDVWINEGLSAAAEYIYSGQESQDRVDYYTNGGGAIALGNNFFVWGGAGTWEDQYPDTVLDNYATVYLFFRWLGIQAGSGTFPDNSIYSSIINASVTNYNAVLGAVDTKANDVLHGSWGDLLKEWLLANYYNLSTGAHGYENGITVTPPLYTDGGSAEPFKFAPGEAMFFPISTSPYNPAPSGSNIKYIGLTSGGYDDLSTGGYMGNTILLINGNPNNEALDEYGYVASVASASGSRSVARSTYEMPKSWIMDAGVMGNDDSRELTGRALEASHKKTTARPSLRKAN